MAAVQSCGPRIFTKTSYEVFDQDTPKHPYLTFTLNPATLQSLVVKTWSHDQGWCNEHHQTQDPYGNSYTWFSFGLVDDATLAQDDRNNLLEFQRNVRGSGDWICHTNQWHFGTSSKENGLGNEVHGWIKTLTETENATVGVFALAGSPGWQNTVWKIEVLVFPRTVHEDQHSEQPRSVHSTPNPLSRRQYSKEARYVDLEENIPIIREAIKSTPETHQNRAPLVRILGIHLHHKGGIADVEEAIAITLEALKATPEDHPVCRAELQYELGRRVYRRHSHTGAIADIDGAIAHFRKAVTAIPKNHPAFTTIILDLGGILRGRYERTGELDDLELAISNVQQARSIMRKGHPNFVVGLSSLGGHLVELYRRTRETKDLEAAFENAKQAVDNMPEHYHNVGVVASLKIFGMILIERYDRTGDVADLDAAISNVKQIISRLPTKKDIDFIYHSVRLGDMLRRRSERTGNAEDLEIAISTAEEAINTLSEDRPLRANVRMQLGSTLWIRYKRTGNKDDLESAIQSYEEASKSSSAASFVRLEGALRAMRIAAYHHMWERASELAQEAINFLHSVCGRYLRRQDQYQSVIETAGLAHDRGSGLATVACSLSLKLGHVEKALQRIEFGRGLILGYSMDNQSEISTLRTGYPDLAKEFEELQFAISKPIDDKELTVRHQLIAERREAIQRLEDCLEQIRQKEGHERFYLEPLLEELLRGAEEGPVIIVNISNISSDAIIVTLSGVKRVELPEMTPPKVKSFLAWGFGRDCFTDESLAKHERDIPSETDMSTRYSAGFLSLLWMSCVKPILEHLPVETFESTKTPRVWWIGAGLASTLPFHAAGDYSGNSPKDSTLSRVISSYTPTIKALVHARSCAARSVDKKHDKTSVLVVAMPDTPGQTPLSGAITEMAAVREALGDIFTVNQLVQPSVEQVMGELGQSDIVHFACHGLSDPADPSNSHLLLSKITPSGLVEDRLTLQAISDRESLGKARIAFLSACSTAEVKAGKFVDEALHIVSAFQVAGFGHVIGSLWSADDNTSARVAKLFYESLVRNGGEKVTNRAVAGALRDAILQVREERGIQDPRLWAPYIHSGA